MKPLSLLFSLLILSSFSLHGQTPPPSGTPAVPDSTAVGSVKPLLVVKLPGGTYEVAVGAILAVTSHEYLVEGVARVTEVNVDTSGSLLVRFYYIEPTTPNSPIGLGNATIEKAQELMKEAANRTGQDVWKKVIKNYPTTTHARTVEYRLVNKEDLNKIFEAADQAFRTGKGRSIKIADTTQ